MRKLFIRLIIFVVLVGTILLLWEKLSLTVENKSLIQLQKEVRLLSKCKYISLGTSEGKRFKMGYGKKEEVSSLCINGNDIFTVQKQLKEIGPFIGNKTVFINVPYFFLRYKADTLHEDMTQNLRMFYYCLPLKYITLSNILPITKSRLYVINSIRDQDVLVKKVTSKKSGPDDKKEMEMDAADNKAPITEDQLEHPAFYHRHLMASSVKAFPKIDSITKNCLAQIKDLAAKYNVKLIFYSMPHQVVYKKTLGNTYADSLDKDIAGTLSSNGLIYFNYFNDSNMVNDMSYFKDGTHLNTKGAQQFIKELFSELRTKNLIMAE